MDVLGRQHPASPLLHHDGRLGQGKFTNGWDLKGVTTGTPTTTVVGSDGNRFPSYACPAGSSFTGMSVNQSHEYTLVEGLSVTNGITTVALPNTPIV